MVSHDLDRPSDPGESPRPARAGRLLARLRGAGSLLAWIAVILCARATLADHYVVPSGSMERTLRPGDRVVVDKRAYGLRVPFTSLELARIGRPQRGDIVIFDSPEDGTRLIKRVVALAGDRVTLSRGRLIVNGTALADPQVPDVERFEAAQAEVDLRFGGGPELRGVLVPEGSVLVIGDSRGNSRDSRYFGFVREDELYGRALGIYYRSGQGLLWRPL